MRNASFWSRRCACAFCAVASARFRQIGAVGHVPGPPSKAHRPLQRAPAYLLPLVRRHYAPEAVAQVGGFVLDRLGEGRMSGDTHVADQILVRPRSPRSVHRVLAA